MPQSEFDLIERFFQLDLNEEELTSFNKRLEEDTNFKNKVNQYELARKTAYDLFLPGYDKLISEKKESLRGNVIQKKTNKRIVYQKWLFAVAASLALIFFANKFMNTSTDASFLETKAMAQDMAHASVNLDAIKNTGTRSSATEAFHPVMEAYEKNDYAKVLELSEAYINQADVLLLRGLAFVKNNENEEAKASFKSLLTLPSGQKDTALWWLVSLNLNEGNLENYTIA